MFRLYGNIAGWKLLDLGADEFDMIATMGEYLQKDENICFLLIKSNENSDEPYKSVHGKKEYDTYSQEYFERLKLQNKTIMELKREMLMGEEEHEKTKFRRS